MINWWRLEVRAAEMQLDTSWWDLTPREFFARICGYEERLKRKRELLAWLAATQINHNGFTSGTVKPRELLGYDRQVTSEDEYREMLDEYDW